MKETIAKSDWLTAQQCPAMAWHDMRAASKAPNEADRFRMEQGQEIGALARKLYPDGILISRADGKTSAQITQDLLGDTTKGIFFEATVLAAPFIAKADVLLRQDGGWHVLEVKSRFSTGKLDELIDDLAYTVMVFKRAGRTVVKASLVLLSREYRFGDEPARLFHVIDATDDVLARAAEFDGTADALSEILFQSEPPAPLLVSACRGCAFFAGPCLGAEFAHTVLEIPGLHHKKLKRLAAEGIIDLSRIPDNLGLNDLQERARNAALTGNIFVDKGLGKALQSIAWPCHYLDFETVATVLPLYDGHGCHRQVLTQFSIHHRAAIDAEAFHSEYLADAAKNCERDLAAALIAALGNEGSIIVYSSFERTRIKALKEAFPELDGPFQAILGRLVDLLSFVNGYVYHPEFKGSFSIKKVLPALVPDLSYKGLDIADGDTAITRFARMARREIMDADVEPTRRQLLDYCKLDTFAMVRLHETLGNLAARTRHAGSA